MKQTPKDIRIPVTIGGVTFKNPFFVASGPTTKSVRQLIEIERTGWAAASIKLSIDPAPYINRKPRYSLFKDRDALAFTAEKRLTFQEGLQLIRDAKPKLHDLLLMANITYAGDNGVDGWVNMAVEFEKAGADIIELNMCCPNMSYNVEMTSGGGCSAKKQTGASMGQNANVAAEIEDTYWVEIDYEQLLTWNPEYIILASDATYTVEDVLADPNLANCTAVMNGNVYQLPNKAEAWDSPVPGSILGALWLANILHPDQISDAQCTARRNGFYETFYHFSYSEN